MEETELPRWMSKREAAEYLRINIYTLNRWVKRGWIQPTKMGRFTRFLEKNVIAMMERTKEKDA
ncbi:MAG: hypothetical protein C0467_21895 [Planctomycetaceae bacterium]|nr:hypothetical protein [Planctomycetaceae bacterium]